MRVNTTDTMPRILVILGYCVLPLIINIFVIVFICLAYDATQPASYPSNILSIFLICYFYVVWGILFGVFSYTTGTWIEILGYVGGLFIVITLAIGYPVFFTLLIPVTVYYFAKLIGSPAKIWELMFEDCCCSLHTFYDGERNACLMILKGIYIGIPYALFVILYFVFLIIMAAVLLATLGPYGLGPIGCAIHHVIRKSPDIKYPLIDTIERTGLWCMFVECWFIAFPLIVILIIYLTVISITWFGITLIVFAILYFLIYVFPTTAVFCCGTNAIQLIQV